MTDDVAEPDERESRLIAMLEAKRRKFMFQVLGLGVGLIGLAAGGVTAYASHASGVATRTSAIALNSRDIGAIRAQVAAVSSRVESMQAKSGDARETLVALKTDMEYIKKALDKMAQQRRK